MRSAQDLGDDLMSALVPVGAVSMEEELVRGVWRHQLIEIQ